MENQVSETKMVSQNYKEKLHNEILGTIFNFFISELQQQILILENEKWNWEKVNFYLSGTIQTKIGNRYTDAGIATYQDLASMRVVADNVVAMIKSVLDNNTNLKLDCFPKSGFVRLMFTESRRLSQLHIAEYLISHYKKFCNALHSNGTWKFQKNYQTYTVTGKD